MEKNLWQVTFNFLLSFGLLLMMDQAANRHSIADLWWDIGIAAASSIVVRIFMYSFEK